MARSETHDRLARNGATLRVRSDPRDGEVPRIIALSGASYRKMIQNLWWAAGYNVFAILLQREYWRAGHSAAAGVRGRPDVNEHRGRGDEYASC